MASVHKAMILPSEQDPLDQKIRQMIVRSRLEVWACMLPLALVMNTLLLLHHLVRNRLWTILVWSWYGVSSDVDMAQLRSPWVLMLLRHLMTVVFRTCPRLSTPACMRVGFCLVYARLIIEASMQSETDFAAWTASTAPVRLGASVMLGELSTATCLNVVLSAVSCWCYTADWHVTFHIYLCGSIWSIIYGIDCARYAQFRAVLEARMSHSVEVAADGLLSRLCDAVVHLGEDLRITQPSPQLAALLLRPSCDGLQSAPFLDLFSCGQESERARGFLRRDAPGADTLHASMRDSNAVVVAVQLFHIRGRDFDDQVFHVVGVREDAESFRMPPEPGPLHASPIVVPPVERAPSEVESVRTLHMESDSGGLAVHFRLFEPGYPVETCSAGFTLLSGPSARGTKLLRWVVSTDSFVECVQELGDSALREGRDLHPRRSVQVRLRPPHVRQVGEELSAEAVLSLFHNGADAEVELWTARMELHDTKVVRRRSRSEKGQFRPPSRRAPSVESIEESSHELDVLEDVHAYFRVLEDGYPVTGSSPRFASLVGLPEAGIGMLDLVVDVEAFITQAQTVFNSAYQSGDVTVSQTCKSVGFRRSRAGASHQSCRFHATVELSMDHNSSADDVSKWTAKAKLHDVRKAPRRARPGGPTGDPTAVQAVAWEKHSDGTGPSCSLQRRRPKADPASDHG